MNDQTTKLVEQLAQKLGTTAEYLWAVLLKQAPISAATDLIYLILVIIGGVLLYKLHKYLSEEGGEYKNSIYCDKEELVVIPMVLVTFLWGVIAIVCFFCIGNIINGFFNPEYWALKEILSQL